MRVKCIRSCNTTQGIKGTSSLGCASAIFEAEACYQAELLGGIDINSYGEVELNFSAEILDGSVDGYDNSNGIRFQSTTWFNYYFQIMEEEEN